MSNNRFKDTLGHVASHISGESGLTEEEEEFVEEQTAASYSEQKRCQRPGCTYFVFDKDVNYCKAHGGATVATSKQLRHLRGFYAIDQVKELIEDGTLKDLTGELAVSKVVMGKILGLANDDAKLAASAGVIADMLVKTQGLALAQHKMDQDTSNSLSQNQVLELCQYLLEAISQELSDLPDKDARMSRLSTSFGASFQRVQLEAQEEKMRHS